MTSLIITYRLEGTWIMKPKTINWPAKYHPNKSAVHVVNTLEMDVSAEAAWKCLIRATDWPNWYSNSANVRIMDAEKTQLDLGVKFRWKTFGMTITCLVEEFELYERLAWSSESLGMRVYHAWVFDTHSRGCRVTTEETQNGFIPKIAKLIMPTKMHKFHQIWLQGLNEIAKNN